EVEDDRALVAVVVGKDGADLANLDRCHRAHAVPLGGLDFYDLGAEVAEDLSGVGSEDDRREIEDAQAFEEGAHWARTGSVKERGGLPLACRAPTRPWGGRRARVACLPPAAAERGSLAALRPPPAPAKLLRVWGVDVGRLEALL